MARYFFDLMCDDDTLADDAGQDFASLDAVRSEVRRILPDMVRDEMANIERTSMSVCVRDAGGRLVYEASLVFTERWH